MTIYLNSNTASLRSQNYLNTVTNSLNKSLERLSSGYKINRAGDGAGQLLASENYRSQIRGSDVAITNVQQGLSMLQVADGSMQQIYEHLQSMRDIAVAARNDTTSTAQLASYKADYSAHISSINDIASNTRFNSLNLIGSTPASGLASFNIQAGANAADQINIITAFSTNNASGLAVSTSTLTATTDASNLLSDVDAALATLSQRMATLGGYESTMESQLSILSIRKENYTAAEASIRNTDVAAETSRVTQLQIIQQAAAYALAQANQTPNIALQLLQ
ncbi:MAG TPA: flagellin [Coleofasciculaceae cyanobacterium]